MVTKLNDTVKTMDRNENGILKVEFIPFFCNRSLFHWLNIHNMMLTLYSAFTCLIDQYVFCYTFVQSANEKCYSNLLKVLSLLLI